MANQIYDVLPGRPFGRGTSTATISSDVWVRASVTGTGGSNTVSVGSTSFSNGDLVFIHQTRGATNTFLWEVRLVVSGGGTGTLTLDENLQRSYYSGAQIIKIPEYLNCTFSSFALSGWDITASRGGIGVIAVKNTLTISGNATVNGSNGYATTSDQGGRGAVGGGYRGGGNSTDGSGAWQGMGYSGTYGNESATNAYNGGGGGWDGQQHCSGGGGGNASTGGVGSNSSTRGGSAVGNASLTILSMGGGGGGGRASSGDSAGGGGNGGGIWIIWARVVVITGTLQAKGGNGGNGYGTYPNNADGGGGAGGSVLINCERATLGTSKIQTNYGTASGDSGNYGGKGWVRMNYGISYTGNPSSTYSTFSAAQDTKLRQPQVAAQVIL